MAGDHPNQLGEYLRARRGLVTPEQVGLQVGPKRRVSGLRREEVAMLAGVSADYIVRLERGRDTNPSAQVLAALSRALQLDEVEEQYMRTLVMSTPRSAVRDRSEKVPTRLRHLLAALGVPAFVEGRRFDVLASNPVALALSPRLRPGENRLVSLMVDPAEREFHADWDAATEEFVAFFRQSIGANSGDAGTAELVAELSSASARFRELWARHDVRRPIGGTARVNHPVVGALELHRDKLPVGDLTLVIYYPDPASDNETKLEVLSSLARRTEVDDGRSGTYA